jgi:hypothetical protein
MSKHDNILLTLQDRIKLNPLSAFPTNWVKKDFVNLASVEPSLGYANTAANINPLSTYYFPVFNKSRSRNAARAYTGNDNFFIKNKNLSYANSNPTFNFDISGSLKSTFSFFPVLTTNLFLGNTGYFNGFSAVNINSNLSALNYSFFNNLSVNNFVLNNMVLLTTVYINLYDPTLANYVFSTPIINLTAGNNFSAYNLNASSVFLTPVVTANNAYFENLLTNEFLSINTLSAKNATVSATNINAFIQIDPSYFSYNGNVLTTNIEGYYFFGVKPSDSYATDDIRIVRNINGNWDGADGSIIETLPVSKPYFKNLQQALDYINYQNLHGEQVSILIYEDIIPTDTNNYSDSRFQGPSPVAANASGNLIGYHRIASQVPTNIGLPEGDYFWPSNLNSPISGGINYITITNSNFKQINIAGMYEIGSATNGNGVKQYSLKKPFNYSPRKIIFRTYICTNPSLAAGVFGSDPTVWKNCLVSNSNSTYVRQISINATNKTDVNIQNLCFEFDGNARDSTGIMVYSGNCYLRNITLAAKGQHYYPYGLISAWPQSTIYICGENQLDPYLLTPQTYNSWSNLEQATDPYYFPGYGLAIVGNESSRNYPTLANLFFNAWYGNIYIMDYNVDRRIGKHCFSNSSIILDGNFNSWIFFNVKDSGKIYSNNYIFRTNNLNIKTLNASIYNGSANGTNVFSNYNKDNFYYVYYENFGTFYPHYFHLNPWNFSDSVPLSSYPLDKNIISVNNQINNQQYEFVDNFTISLSGLLNSKFKHNILKPANILSDGSNLYYYGGPQDLPLYNVHGFYELTSPIDNTSTYTLNYYASGSPTIIPKK